jgi:hypothetical protein
MSYQAHHLQVRFSSYYTGPIADIAVLLVSFRILTNKE